MTVSSEIPIETISLKNETASSDLISMKFLFINYKCMPIVYITSKVWILAFFPAFVYLSIQLCLPPMYILLKLQVLFRCRLDFEKNCSSYVWKVFTSLEVECFHNFQLEKCAVSSCLSHSSYHLYWLHNS